MSKTLQIMKAGDVAGEVPPDVVITISMCPPDFVNLDHAGAFFVGQAESLELALRRSLPGGTYDQLLAAMMRQRASLFAVPLWGKCQETDQD